MQDMSQCCRLELTANPADLDYEGFNEFSFLEFVKKNIFLLMEMP